MSMSARILPAFDHIIEGTRQHLESIPDDRLGWKPHDKSYSIGDLGTHLANLPSWVMATIGQDELDVALRARIHRGSSRSAPPTRW